MSDAVSVASSSVLEPLMPLVRAGYKSLAGRAAEGLRAWYSGLDQGLRGFIDDKLALLKLPGSSPAPTIYFASGGVVRQRTLSSSSLLEAAVTGATSELSELANDGEVGRISIASFGELFFALDYSVFKRQPNISQSLEIAIGVAVRNYQTVGEGEFVRQLEVASRLGRIEVSEQLQRVDYTEDGKLTSLVFKLTPRVPSVLNIITSLRLLYIAANAVSPKQQNYQDMSQKIAAAATAQGISSDAFSHFLAENSSLQIVAEQLDKVSLHKGVEALINGCEQLSPPLKVVLSLTKILDAVRTGKIALEDKDKPYSDAIGLAELVG